MDQSEYLSGTLIEQYQYHSFSPTLINRPYKWMDSRVDVLLEEANRYIGELNAYSQLIPDVDFFIKMHILKEATTSSRIEGTKTSVEEAMLSKDDIDPERRDDWTEVQNYTRAMNHAIFSLRKLPLSMRLLNETHKILLSGARGKHKTPGEIRRSQNWIGGSSPRDATFVPPHHSELDKLLSDLESYWHNENINIPHLIRIAISHYQFETIHPYQDGNGRLGRLLITLYLIDKQILNKPTLYLSAFFEKNRSAYYDSLMRVRTANDLEHWIKFFLVGTSETAQSSIRTFQNIIKLKHSCEESLVQMGKRAKSGAVFLKLLYSKPIVNSKWVAGKLDLSSPATNALIECFVEHKILREITGYRRNRLFAFSKYVRLFSDKSPF